jgi:RNA polymerase sigma-32 factor
MRNCYSLSNDDDLSDYISSIKNIPTLSNDEEFLLASRWKETGDQKALNKIINSHLKLVLKIAKGYSGYGISLSDLVAEGNLGIMHAVQHFDPNIGYRFSTYAAWWIKAKIREFIFNSWSIVKLGSSKTNRKLFFGLRKIKDLLGIKSSPNAEEIRAIANKMEVSKESVITVENRFTQRDFSVNSPVQENAHDSVSWIEFIEDAKSRPDIKILDQQEHSYRKKVLHDALNTLSKKERDILCLYRLSNPTKSLSEIGKIVNLSAERVRQLEKRAFLKIQKYVKSVSENKIKATAACFLLLIIWNFYK